MLVEEDHRRLWKDADVEQPDDVAAGVGGPSSSHRERMPGRTSRWGRGSLGHTQDDHQTFDRGRRCARAVAVVGTRTGGALACRPERASARASGDAGLSKEQLRSGPRRVPATAQIRPTQQRAVGRSEALTLLPSARSSGLDQRACLSFEAGAGDAAELPSRRALRH